jgi:hypothetical protein
MTPSSHRFSWLWPTAIVVVAAVLDLENVTPYPWLVGLVAAALALALVARAGTGAVRTLGANVALIAGIFAVGEGWAAYHNHDPILTEKRMDKIGHYEHLDPDLGYALVPNQRAHIKKTGPTGVLYDATYTTGPDGYRATLGTDVSAPVPAVFCFGDSFTIGEGLDEPDTYPTYLQSALGSGYRVFNRGMHGYGPHQFLRSLELGLDKAAAGAVRPTYGIFMGFPFHAERSAGKVGWDQHGPKYTLDAHGIPVYQGHFNPWPADPTFTLKDQWLGVINTSQLGSFILGRLRGDATQQDRELMYGIVAQAARVFEQRYGTPLIVVLGLLDQTDVHSSAAEWRRELAARGVTHVYVAHELVPGFNPKTDLLPVDRHPNGRANKPLAEALAKVVQDLAAEQAAKAAPAH